MKRVFRLCLLLAVSLAAGASAGDIQVTCDPGLRVYLDGTLIGVSSAKDDGMFLTSVTEGPHTVRVERDGFIPLSYHVEVSGSPIEVKVEGLVPQPPASVAAEQAESAARPAVATLVVTSAPQNCTVEIDGRTETKTTPALIMSDLAVGEHRISFSKEGYTTVSGVVRLHPGIENTVRGDLIAGKVESIHEGKGSLRVFSNPEFCTIQIFGMKRDKTRSVFNLSHIPAGEHRLVVSFKNRQLATDVIIKNGQRTRVTVDMLKQEKPFTVTYEPE
jgi:hypothetical protein